MAKNSSSSKRNSGKGKDRATAGDGKRSPGRRAEKGTTRDTDLERPNIQAREVEPSFLSGTGVSVGLKRAGTALTDSGAAVTGAIVANPVPVALIGAGLAWLLLSGRAAQLKERAYDLFDDSLGDVPGRIKDAVSSGVETVGDAVGGLGQSIQSGTSTASKKVRKTYKKGLAATSQAWEEHPLAITAALLAAGVTVGLLLPGTMSENGVLGRQSDALKQRAKAASKTIVKQGKKATRALRDSVGLEAVGTALGATEVIGKVRKLAEQVQDATLDAARRVHLVSAGDEKDVGANTAKNGRSRKHEDD
jgi:hypothetical protein